MENQKLERAINDYDPAQSDYELFWELAFSSSRDFEEIAQRSWQLSNEPPHLPIPFLALACRLCWEISLEPQRRTEALSFLKAHSDYGDETNLSAFVEL